MVAIRQPKQEKPTEHIVWTSREEGEAFFDRQARALMNMSGEEFIRRWDSGEFRDIADTPGHRHILRLASLIPFGR